MSLGVLFVANLFLSLNLVRLRRRTAASGSFSAQVKFPLFGDQVAELVLLASPPRHRLRTWKRRKRVIEGLRELTSRFR